jgi:hypothetical protein
MKDRLFNEYKSMEKENKREDALMHDLEMTIEEYIEETDLGRIVEMKLKEPEELWQINTKKLDQNDF